MRCWWGCGGWHLTRPGCSEACFTSFHQTSKPHLATAVLQHGNTKEHLVPGQSGDMPGAGTPQPRHAECCSASLPCSLGGFCTFCAPLLACSSCTMPGAPLRPSALALRRVCACLWGLQRCGPGVHGHRTPSGDNAGGIENFIPKCLRPPDVAPHPSPSLPAGSVGAGCWQPGEPPAGGGWGGVSGAGGCRQHPTGSRGGGCCAGAERRSRGRPEAGVAGEPMAPI